MKKLEQILNENDNPNESLEAYLNRKKQKPNVSKQVEVVNKELNEVPKEAVVEQKNNVPDKKSETINESKIEEIKEVKKDNTVKKENKKPEKVVTNSGVEIDKKDVPQNQFRIKKKKDIESNTKNTNTKSNTQELGNKTNSIDSTNIVISNSIKRTKGKQDSNIINSSLESEVKEDVEQLFEEEVVPFSEENPNIVSSNKTAKIKKTKKTKTKNKITFNPIKLLRKIAIVMAISIIFLSLISFSKNSSIIKYQNNSRISDVINVFVDFFGLTENAKNKNISSLDNILEKFGIHSSKNKKEDISKEVSSVSKKDSDIDQNLLNNYEYSISINKPANYQTLTNVYDDFLKSDELYKELNSNKNCVILDGVFVETELSTSKQLKVDKNIYYLNGLMFSVGIEVKNQKDKSSIESLLNQIRVIVETDYYNKPTSEILVVENVENYIGDLIKRLSGVEIEKISVFAILY